MRTTSIGSVRDRRRASGGENLRPYWLARPSHQTPFSGTSHASWRSGPAVSRQLAIAWLLASAAVSAIAQPKPGVPSFGSSASAAHWLVKVAMTLHSARAVSEPIVLQPATALDLASSVLEALT